MVEGGVDQVGLSIQLLDHDHAAVRLHLIRRADARAEQRQVAAHQRSLGDPVVQTSGQVDDDRATAPPGRRQDRPHRRGRDGDAVAAVPAEQSQRVEFGQRRLQGAAAEVNRITGALPLLLVREGAPRDALLALLDEEKRISILVLASSVESSGPGPLITALSAIDIALWDLKGKAVERPVYALLGGALRQRVPREEVVHALVGVDVGDQVVAVAR